jgi:hypothetical protein
MPRIRTIKPEFWTSESVGRLPRDARLLFIALWNLADDSGRVRGSLPYLSGAAFPYDEDARSKIGGWIAALEKEGMIRRYAGTDGNAYLDIPKWATHQKIDKPSPSKLPAFSEASTTIPRSLPEASPLDQGSGTVDQGAGSRDLGAQAEPAPEAHAKASVKFVPPTVDEVAAYCDEHGYSIDCDRFVNHYEGSGWMRGKTKIKSWQACVRTWVADDKKKGPAMPKCPYPPNTTEALNWWVLNGYCDER